MELEEEEVQNTKTASCAGLRQELKECILNSDCVKNGNHPRDCMKAESKGAEECKKLQYAFFECKRSLLDFRSRFRGRKGY